MGASNHFQSSHSAASGQNLGGRTTFGQELNTSISWAGQSINGVEPIDVVRATLERVQWMQEKTTAASERNAKLQIKLMQAVEEFDGVSPSIGGELNNLIPQRE